MIGICSACKGVHAFLYIPQSNIFTYRVDPDHAAPI
jgi:hypothetical protein